MLGLVDVERTPGLTLAPGPNTTDPHSSCDRFLSPWPASPWPPMRLPASIWDRSDRRDTPRPLTLSPRCVTLPVYLDPPIRPQAGRSSAQVDCGRDDTLKFERISRAGPQVHVGATATVENAFPKTRRLAEKQDPAMRMGSPMGGAIWARPCSAGGLRCLRGVRQAAVSLSRRLIASAD
jgi:hypothetical protein